MPSCVVVDKIPKNMAEKERVLLEVHVEALKEWSHKNDGDKLLAISLLQSILEAESKYDRIVRFEHDPWQTDKTDIYDWDDIAKDLFESAVTISGVQRDLCIREVYRQLEQRLVDVQVDDNLTMNSVYLR